MRDMSKIVVAVLLGASLVSLPSMADSDLGTKTLSVKTTERTQRFNLEASLGGDVLIQSYREVVQTNSTDSTVLSKTPGVLVQRTLSAVTLDTVVVGGKTIAFGDVAKALAAFADKWRDQDKINNPAP